MRRYFFRPNLSRTLISLALTLLTFYTSIIPIPLSEEIAHARFFAKAAITTAYFAIGPWNPVLKIVTLFVFWLIVSWVVYVVVWLLELIYVRVFNFYVIQTKYKNR